MYHVMCILVVTFFACAPIGPIELVSEKAMCDQITVSVRQECAKCVHRLCVWCYFQVNLIIIRPTAQSIVSFTFAEYALKPFFSECEAPAEAVRLLAALCICKCQELCC